MIIVLLIAALFVDGADWLHIRYAWQDGVAIAIVILAVALASVVVFLLPVFPVYWVVARVGRKWGEHWQVAIVTVASGAASLLIATLLAPKAWVLLNKLLAIILY
ncbi:MAG: hypothetical protein ABH814_03325 [bacterium]